MAIDAHRWLMTAPKAPMERAAFEAAPQAGGKLRQRDVHDATLTRRAGTVDSLARLV